MTEQVQPHHVSYYTRRTGNGYPYRTDAECSCGWAHSTHSGTPLREAVLIGEQHLSGHVMRREGGVR